MEIGWLLDDGRLCVGAGRWGFVRVPYTHPAAIRFARREDAERMRYMLRTIGMPMTADHVKPVEHGWNVDQPEPTRYDA